MNALQQGFIDLKIEWQWITRINVLGRHGLFHLLFYWILGYVDISNLPEKDAFVKPDFYFFPGFAKIHYIPPPEEGSALRKKPSSRKIDKFGESEW